MSTRPAARAWILAAAALATLACDGAPERPRSVVCIVVDTLRADRLGAYGYAERPTTPRLDAWLARARVYERAHATSPWTLPSLASLFTARWPVHHGAGRRAADARPTGITPLPEELPTLAERLRAAGFATAGIVSNAFLAPSFGVARGFEHYDFQNATVTNARRANVAAARALAWLDARPEREQPFLLLLHLFDPHMNYDAPPPFRGRFSGALEAEAGLSLPVAHARELRREARSLPEPQRRFTAAAYDEEVAFVDAALGDFLDALEARGALRDTLVVLTADHGEELFEHDGFEHGHALWQQLLHVPLAFWGPGVRPGREPAPVSLVDLAPTLLDALAQAPLERSDGLSLWPNLSAQASLPLRPLYAEQLRYGAERKAVIQGSHKLVWFPDLDVWRHFDLAGDPSESRSGDALDTPELRALQASARELWSREPAAGRAAPLDAETLEALKGLGYLE